MSEYQQSLDFDAAEEFRLASAELSFFVAGRPLVRGLSFWVSRLFGLSRLSEGLSGVRLPLRGSPLRIPLLISMWVLAYGQFLSL